MNFGSTCLPELFWGVLCGRVSRPQNKVDSPYTFLSVGGNFFALVPPASVNSSVGVGALTPADFACPSSGVCHGGKKGCTLQRLFSHKQASRLPFSKNVFQPSAFRARNRPKIFLQIRTFLLFQSSQKSTKTPFPTAFSAMKRRIEGGVNILTINCLCI